MMRLWSSLAVDESGEALVEYSLLVALVALATIMVVSDIQKEIKTAYVGWNTAMLNLWQMPAPGALGGR